MNAVFWAKVCLHRLGRLWRWAVEDVEDLLRIVAGLPPVVARRPLPGASPYPYLLFSHASPLIRNPARAAEEFQVNKVHNLRVAASSLDGVVIGPGQVFSFCRMVGRTTRGKGYLPALTLINDRLLPVTGGGLCQMSNMIYWMALHLGMEIIERHRHSYDLFPDAGRALPFGCGATVFYNYVDLRFRNTLPFPISFKFRVTEARLEGEAYGTRRLPFSVRVFETDHAFYESGSGKRRRNRVWKRVATTGRPDTVELVAENDCLVLY
ncbi:MAG: VanW family protein [Ignavibacteriales bacterium]